ncbi:MAG: hypothetical protein JJT75_10340 [Opitutales bacterium]|nr:hypothetical protein [Opitutales bacterium]
MLVWFQTPEEAAIYAGYMRSKGFFAECLDMPGAYVFGPMGFGGVRVMVSEHQVNERKEAGEKTPAKGLFEEALGIMGWFVFLSAGLVVLQKVLIPFLRPGWESLTFLYSNFVDFLPYLPTALPDFGILVASSLLGTLVFCLIFLLYAEGVKRVVFQFRKVRYQPISWNQKLWLYPLIVCLLPTIVFLAKMV